jgi:general secretion pathway protein E
MNQTSNDNSPSEESSATKLAQLLEGSSPCPNFTRAISINFARDHGVLGIRNSRSTFLLLTRETTPDYVCDQMRRIFGPQFETLSCEADQLDLAINRFYEQRSSQTDSVLRSLKNEPVDFELSGAANIDLLDAADRAPVVGLVNSILFDAISQRASDIHVQPSELELLVRFRIDGVLFDQLHIPNSRQEEVLSRLKIIGRMNIAEKRLPQDGRATVRVGNRIVDLRIASLPSVHGERIVVRLLDKSARLYTLSELGMAQAVFERLSKLIHLEHGIVLVTGPTGSGKSTTLYAALQEINAKDRNIVTLEDPVEYQLDGISQTQINEKKGMTFASGLRSVLRQDPDVIMVGEIRDEDTAKMAIQSALTGHIVFSTLHTNDAASAVTRLLDLGIEPYLVSSSVVGVLAQRLVRRICTACKVKVERPDRKPTEPNGLLQQLFSKGPVAVCQGTGCERCRNTGYFGRIGLFELLVVDEPVRNAIQTRANASQIRLLAINDGLQLMYADGIEKIRNGVTTIEEVLRVSQRATE